MGRIIKVLSIDGGGIRGIIPALVLAEIEHRSGRPIRDLFDIVAGSSTGGLLAMALVTPDEQNAPAYTAEEVAVMYEREGPLIFSRSMWRTVSAVGNINGAKYPSTGIDNVLERYFGDLMLSDALGDILVTGYEIQRRQPWFFRSAKARLSQTCNFRMRDVVRSTTAAPTYFEPAQVFHPELDKSDYFALIDGSMQANNPAMAAFVEAKDKNPHADEFFVLSLGTGDHTRPLPYDEAKQWGLAGWSQHILQVAFDAMSRSVDYQLRHLLPTCHDGIQHYYRLQTPLLDGASDDLDDVSDKNLLALKKLSDRLIIENDRLLDDIVERLLVM